MSASALQYHGGAPVQGELSAKLTEGLCLIIVCLPWQWHCRPTVVVSGRSEETKIIKKDLAVCSARSFF